MEKMRMESPDGTQRNIEHIATLFPNCITEAKGEDGKLRKVINFEMLRQMLSGDVIEGDEAYEFTWVGKKASIVEANKPIRMTLRPCPEESVNWDTTENLYIEGDNLNVLKLMQESYLSKVKLIYIDPPYNTGNDFVYKDDFSISQHEYDEENGAIDDDGNRMFRNTDSNGRFHSVWCSMMYPRLTLARNLLSDDGVIFISIDENEADSAKKICDNGTRRFIMVQVPQESAPDSDAARSGFHTICDIGKERIRQAGQRINKTLQGHVVDSGFRVLKCDDTNMKDVYYAADEFKQQTLLDLVSNIKEDRTDLDLLFGCLLEWGLPLSLPYTSETIDGCTVHTYNEGDLIACFDENVPDNVVKAIAHRQPLRAVFRDSSFADSPAKINVGEIFKLLAPDTRVKVI